MDDVATLAVRATRRSGMLVAFASCLALGLVSSGRAGELAGVSLPESVRVGDSTLVLNGMGVREATWLRINVYVAGLYLEARASDADAIVRAELPKRIAFVFVRSVGRKRIVAEWDESLEANLGEHSAALEYRVATLYTWMPDRIRKGDEMALTYLPGQGITVEMMGEVKGLIPGADFGRALFSIWLGPRPPNQTLKSGLLGHD